MAINRIITILTIIEKIQKMLHVHVLGLNAKKNIVHVMLEENHVLVVTVKDA